MLSQVERRQSVAKIEEQEKENQSDENIEPKDIYTKMKNAVTLFSQIHRLMINQTALRLNICRYIG